MTIYPGYYPEGETNKSHDDVDDNNDVDDDDDDMEDDDVDMSDLVWTDHV